MSLVNTLFGPYKLLYYIGVVPYYDSKSRTFKRTKLIPTANLCVCLTSEGIGIWYTITDFLLGHSGNTKLVLQLFMFIIMVLLNLEAITGTASRYVRIYRNVFDSFAKIDATIKPNPLKRLKTKLAVLCITLFAYTIYDCIYWQVIKGVQTNFFLTNMYFQVLFLYCLLLVMCTFLWLILSRYTEMNRALQAFCGNIQELDRLIMVQEVMHGLVDEFNEIYGKAMLLIIGFMIANTLTAVNVYLEVFSGYNFAQLCCWIFFIYVPSIVITYFCEQILRQGKKTTVITFKLIKKYKNFVGIRQGLYILLQQSINLAPGFSAAGFFDVNFSMLFTFLNMIATYVIVVIQFSHKLDDVT